MHWWGPVGIAWKWKVSEKRVTLICKNFKAYLAAKYMDWATTHLPSCKVHLTYAVIKLVMPFGFMDFVQYGVD